MRFFTLTLDDFSWHPKTGGDFESIKWCDKLIEKFPDLKVNLFVPAAYARLGEIPCLLSNNKQWVNKVNSLPQNYCINLHGYNHRRVSKKYGNSNNDEWQYLTYDEAKVLGIKMLDEFKLSGLKYTPTFRPGGWKISAEACRALEDIGVTLFAGSKEYFNKVKKSIRTKWISYNWDLTSECAVSGNIIAFGHTSNWTNNYMDESRYNLILKLLEKEKFEFKFIEEM